MRSRLERCPTNKAWVLHVPRKRLFRWRFQTFRLPDDSRDWYALPDYEPVHAALELELDRLARAAYARILYENELEGLLHE